MKYRWFFPLFIVVDMGRPSSRGTQYCNETQVIVEDVDHFCPWTGLSSQMVSYFGMQSATYYTPPTCDRHGDWEEEHPVFQLLPCFPHGHDRLSRGAFRLWG
jgi:hypothetical protein